MGPGRQPSTGSVTSFSPWDSLSVPTELTVAETVGSTVGNPPLNKWGLQAQLGGAFSVSPRAGAAQDTAAPWLLAQGSSQGSHVILTVRHHFFSRYLFSGHRLSPPLLLWAPQTPPPQVFVWGRIRSLRV